MGKYKSGTTEMVTSDGSQETINTSNYDTKWVDDTPSDRIDETAFHDSTWGEAGGEAQRSAENDNDLGPATGQSESDEGADGPVVMPYVPFG